MLDRMVATSRHFQGAVVSPLGTGSIRADPNVPLAVRARKPFLIASPGSVASRGVRRLARALVRERHPPAPDHGRGFFAALAALGARTGHKRCVMKGLKRWLAKKNCATGQRRMGGAESRPTRPGSTGGSPGRVKQVEFAGFSDRCDGMTQAD